MKPLIPEENKNRVKKYFSESDIEEMCRLAEEQAEGNRQFFKWVKERSNEMLEKIKRDHR